MLESIVQIKGAESQVHSEDNWNYGWTIGLENVLGYKNTLRLFVVDDTVIGRRTEESSVDLDLTPHGGWVAGVSRQHAALCPTRDLLYVVDLSSTRGTCVNGIPVVEGRGSVLLDGDLVTLGSLVFRVRIVKRPVM